MMKRRIYPTSQQRL